MSRGLPQFLFPHQLVFSPFKREPNLKRLTITSPLSWTQTPTPTMGGSTKGNTLNEQQQNSTKKLGQVQMKSSKIIMKCTCQQLQASTVCFCSLQSLIFDLGRNSHILYFLFPFLIKGKHFHLAQTHFNHNMYHSGWITNRVSFCWFWITPHPYFALYPQSNTVILQGGGDRHSGPVAIVAQKGQIGSSILLSTTKSQRFQWNPQHRANLPYQSHGNAAVCVCVCVFTCNTDNSFYM